MPNNPSKKALDRKSKVQANKAAAIERNQTKYKLIGGILAFIVGIAGIALLVDFFRRIGAEGRTLKNTRENPRTSLDPYRNSSLSHHRAGQNGFSPKPQGGLAIRPKQKNVVKESLTLFKMHKQVYIYFTEEGEVGLYHPSLTRAEAIAILKEGINKLDHNGIPPLHVNPGQTLQEKLNYFEFILKLGGDPTFKIYGLAPIEYFLSASLEVFPEWFKERTIELLLQYGVKPDDVSMKGISHLQYTVSAPLSILPSNLKEKLVKLFLHHGANPNVVDRSGLTLLQYTVSAPLSTLPKKLKRKLVEIFLHHGVAIGEWVNDYAPPVAAVKLRLGEVLKLLLSHDKTAESKLIYLAAHEANSESLQFLKECGVDLSHAIFSRGETLFHAIAKGTINSPNENLLKELVDLGVDINIEDEEGYTPLHYAIEWNQPMIKPLLLAGASPSYKSNLPETYSPFALAFYYRQDLSLYIKHGYNLEELICFPGNNYLKPMTMAILWGHEGMADLFFENGAHPNLKEKFHVNKAITIPSSDPGKSPLYIPVGEHDLEEFMTERPFMRKYLNKYTSDNRDTQEVFFLGAVLVAVVTGLYVKYGEYIRKMVTGLYVKYGEYIRKMVNKKNQPVEDTKNLLENFEKAKKKAEDTQRRAELKKKKEQESIDEMKAEVEKLEKNVKALELLYSNVSFYNAKLGNLQNKYNQLKGVILKDPKVPQNIKLSIKEDFFKIFSSCVEKSKVFLKKTITKLDKIEKYLNNPKEMENFQKTLTEFRKTLVLLRSDIEMKDKPETIFNRLYDELENSFYSLNSALNSFYEEAQIKAKKNKSLEENNVKKKDGKFSLEEDAKNEEPEFSVVDVESEESEPITEEDVESGKSESSSEEDFKHRKVKVHLLFPEIEAKQSVVEKPIILDTRWKQQNPPESWNSFRSPLMTGELYGLSGPSSTSRNNLGILWEYDPLSIFSIWREARFRKCRRPVSDSACSSSRRGSSSGDDAVGFSLLGNRSSSGDSASSWPRRSSSSEDDTASFSPSGSGSSSSDSEENISSPRRWSPSHRSSGGSYS